MKLIFKITILIIYFTLFKSTTTYSQDNLKEYNRLSDSIAKYGDTDVRLKIEFFKKQLFLAKRDKDTVKIVKALHNIGRSSQFIVENYQSNLYFEKELQLLRTINVNSKKYQTLQNDKYTEIEVLAQLGQNYASLGQIKKAFDFYNRCLEIAHSQNLEFYKAVMPTIIANLHFTIGNYQEALKKHKESFQALKEVKGISEYTKIHNRGATVISMSDTYIKLSVLDSALWVLDKGIENGLDTVSLSMKSSFIGQRGNVYRERKEFDKAIIYYVEAEKFAFQYDSLIAPSYFSFQLAECYFKLKKYELAIAKLENGLKVKELKTKKIHLTEDYKLLAKIYKEAGNLEKSNEYFEKYIISQTALEKSKDTIVSSFHNEEMSNLNRAKTVQNKQLLVIIGITSAVGLLFLFMLIRFYKQKKRNEHKFQELFDKTNVHKENNPKIIDTKDNILEEKNTSDVNEDTTQQILKGLQKLEEQEYFLKQECNSYNVAKKIKTNTSYLSKVINSHFQKNFNTYINDLRINYAIVQLKNNSRFRSFSIQSIAEEIGYKSADSFTKYFKLRTGLNPSFYIKQLNSLY